MYAVKIHNPNNLPTVDYRIVKPLQGSLKDLTEENAEKLRNVLNKRGFDIPLFIWDNGTELYLMDGHGRQRVMKTYNMSDNGNYEVPYIIVEAKDIKEAKAKLLEITSQYQTVTQEGLDEFIAVAELPEFEVIEATHFDALNFSKDELEDDFDDSDKVECPVCGSKVERDKVKANG